MSHRFVFVHGAWHGAWCFDLLRLELQRRGVRTEAVDLPALGDDATPVEDATFEAGVERIVEALAARKNSILVGHSFGSFYTAAAAARTPERVRTLIDLTGYAPCPGDSFADAEARIPAAPEFRAALSRNAEGTAVLLDPERAAEFLYHDVAEGIAAAAVPRLRPQPLEPFRQAAIAAPAEALARVARRAIVAENDRVLSPEGCVEAARRAGVAVESVPTGHTPFLSMPRLMADVLLGVA